MQNMAANREFWISTILSYLILAMIVMGNLLFYFVEYTSFAEMDEAVSTGMIEYRLGTFLSDQPANTQFVVFGRPWLSHDTPAVLYLAPHVQGFNAPADWDMFEESQLTADQIIFVFLPEYQSQIEPIRERYPGGALSTLNSKGGILFWAYGLAMK